MADGLVAGHPLHWRVVGQGPRPAVALHCSLAHGGAWGAVAERLGDALSVTLPDLPGHGRSGDWHPGGETLHDLTTRIARTLAAPGPVDLIGHSFGATVALRLAVETPALVRSLTLVEPVLFAAARGMPAFDAFFAADAAFAGALAAGDTMAAAAAFHALWGNATPFAALPPAQRSYIAARIALIPTANATLIEDAAGILRPGGLESLSMPVALVEGAASPPVIAAIQTALAARLPAARRTIIPGAGHMAPITHPEAVADAVRALF
ncbi:MAG: alpha/beta fold hydrolase [Gemmobacter sp.]